MIKFNSIKFKNFRSYKQETIFTFNKTSFNLIIGENGTGKSSIFRALIWGLIGTDSEGIKGTNLKNWNNRGNCFIEIDFNIDDRNYILYRQQAPNKLKLNNKDIDQKAIDNLFNFNTKIFSLILFMSQFSDQFIHASSTEKLELFTQILELEKWNLYSENAKNKTHDLNNKLQLLIADKERLKGKKEALDTIGYDADMKVFEINRKREILGLERDNRNADDKIGKLQKEIGNLKIKSNVAEEKYKKDLQQKINKSLSELKRKEKELAQLKCEIVKDKSITDLTKKLNNLQVELKDKRRQISSNQSKIHTIKGRLNDKIEKFENLEDTTCKECNQKISGNHAKQQVEEFRTESKKEIELIHRDMLHHTNDSYILRELIQDSEKNIDKINKDNEQNNHINIKIMDIKVIISDINSKITYLDKEFKLDAPEVIDIQSNINRKDNEIIYLKKQIQDIILKNQSITNEINPYIEKIFILQKDKDEINRELQNEQDKYSEVENEKTKVEYWIKAFKEIKLLITEESIKEFNYFCNDNLHKLGLTDWTIENSIDKILKNKKIKRGFNTLISNQENENDIPLNCFSGGEQQRLKLAMIFGLIDFLNSRININIEIYDEATTWLSEAGIEDLLTVLNERSSNKSIYLIDHRDFKSSGKFDNIYNIKKDKKGSVINK